VALALGFFDEPTIRPPGVFNCDGNSIALCGFEFGAFPRLWRLR
jgi:hypothetical protein